jgi:uncharacterized protein with PQ loop repeat
VSSDVIRAVLAPFLVGLSVAFVWPQVVRSFRSVQGLSLASIAQSIVGSWLWVLYGFAVHEPPLVLANGSAGFGFSLVLVAAVRAGAVSRLRAGLLVVLLVAIGIARLGVDSSTLGWVAIAVGATGILPQVARTLAASDHTGVSRPTYLMVLALSSGWSVYGILADDWLIVLPNLIILPSAATVLVRTRSGHAHRADAATSASSSATV